jgi:hypothetical protein
LSDEEEGCEGMSIFVEPSSLRLLPFQHYVFREFSGDFDPTRVCGLEETLRAVQCLSEGIGESLSPRVVACWLSLSAL